VKMIDADQRNVVAANRFDSSGKTNVTSDPEYGIKKIAKMTRNISLQLKASSLRIPVI
tara:strand:+ start:197 stop:370 length:174 start_codon:yes stop_codon:yes gene_type:complete